MKEEKLDLIKKQERKKDESAMGVINYFKDNFG